MVVGVHGEDLRNNLIAFLNRLKIFKDEVSFKGVLDEFTRFVEERGVGTELLGEVLGGFIVDRCDNMLANISFSDEKLRGYVYELSLEAFKLWLYSALQHLLKESDVFCKYVLELEKGLRIESSSLDGIKKKLEEIMREYLKVMLNDEGTKLVSNAIIDNVKSFKELLPIIEQAVSRGLIKIILVPNNDGFRIPLFFKEYYSSATDYDKVRRTVIALERIIKQLKPYFRPNNLASSYIEYMGKTVRNILGTESLDKYVAYNENQQEDYIIEAIRDKYIHLKVTYEGGVVCEAHNWQSFLRECVGKVLNLSHLRECMWQILYRKTVESPHVKVKLSDILRDVENVKACEEDDADKLERVIDKVINENGIEEVEILNRRIKVIVKPNFKDLKTDQVNDFVVMGVHTKNNGRVEIVVNNDKVYQVPRNKLKDIINKEILPRIIYDNIVIKDYQESGVRRS